MLLSLRVIMAGFKNHVLKDSHACVTLFFGFSVTVWGCLDFSRLFYSSCCFQSCWLGEVASQTTAPWAGQSWHCCALSCRGCLGNKLRMGGSFGIWWLLCLHRQYLTLKYLGLGETGRLDSTQSISVSGKEIHWAVLFSCPLMCCRKWWRLQVKMRGSWLQRWLQPFWMRIFPSPSLVLPRQGMDSGPLSSGWWTRSREIR